MIYAARYDTMNRLLGYLTENCCRGAPAQACVAAGVEACKTQLAGSAARVPKTGH